MYLFSLISPPLARRLTRRLIKLHPVYCDKQDLSILFRLQPKRQCAVVPPVSLQKFIKNLDFKTKIDYNVDMETKHHILDSFSVENYLSIKDKQTIFFDSKVKAFYGANASGKTNIYKAMMNVRRFIKESVNPNSHGTPFTPFLLSDSTANKPSFFSFTFHCPQDNTSYSYSFSATTNKILEEEMYDLSSSRARLIFKRSSGSTDSATRNGFNKKMFEGNESVRDDSLLITFARSTKNPYANAVYEAMRNINYLNLSRIGKFRGKAIHILQEHPEYHAQLSSLFKEADFSINNFSYSVTKITPDLLAGSPFNEEVKQRLLQIGESITVETTHTVRNESGDKIDSIIFDMDTQESLGTNNFFNIAVAILDTINNSKVLYIDEFGASMHTDLCKFTIAYFLNHSKNNDAKLIINTHDVGLIKNGSLGILTSENIMIVEKDRLDGTTITPLKERMHRADDNIGKKYALGVYGGVPILSEVAE